MTKLKLSTATAFLPVTMVMIGLATPAAEADEIWNYAGNATNNCLAGDCSQSNLQNDSLNLSVTFQGPLGDDLNSVDLNAESDIVSWTLTDTQGFIDFSSTTSGTLIFDSFSTDADGDIIPITSFDVDGPNFGELNTQAASVSSCESGFCDGIFFYDQNGDLYGAEALSDGVWTPAVPEPSTTLLTALGAGILVLALRHKYGLTNQTTG